MVTAGLGLLGIGAVKGVQRAMASPEPSIETGKQEGQRFRATGGKVPTGQMPGEVQIVEHPMKVEAGSPPSLRPEPTPTPGVWEKKPIDPNNIPPVIPRSEIKST